MKGVLNENIFELSFLLSGEILVNVTGVEHNIVYEEQECYMLYLPKVAGSIKYNKHQPIKEIRFRMDERFIKKHKIDESVNIYEIYDLMYQNAHFLFPITPEKQHVLNEILEDTQVGLAKRLFLESQCLKLIALQLQNILSQEGGIKNKGILKKLIEVQNIIGKDLSKQYSLNELSRIIGVNELMLKKEFKKRFGMTIFQYTTELKMEEAIKLLKYGNKPIYEISDTIGYKNATHFTVAFKKFTGATPREYRRL